MIKGGVHWYALLFVFSFFLCSFILSFFSIVTFLGWTQLLATWIKPEVVATKKYTDTYTTGSSRLDPGFYGVRVVHICVFWVLVCHCQLFVRLWYRVSDVLDLSLVSKRFGCWPHITHVIVLTFKEIKHLSDYRTVGLSDCRTIGLSDYRSDPVKTCMVKWSDKCCHTKNDTLCNQFTSDKFC
jgi:hypothetical protein